MFPFQHKQRSVESQLLHAVEAEAHLEVRNILRSIHSGEAGGSDMSQVLSLALVNGVENVDKSMVALLLQWHADPHALPQKGHLSAHDTAREMLATTEDRGAITGMVKEELVTMLSWFENPHQPQVMWEVLCNSKESGVGWL